METVCDVQLQLCVLVSRECGGLRRCLSCHLGELWGQVLLLQVFLQPHQSCEGFAVLGTAGFFEPWLVRKSRSDTDLSLEISLLASRHTERLVPVVALGGCLLSGVASGGGRSWGSACCPLLSLGHQSRGASASGCSLF